MMFLDTKAFQQTGWAHPGYENRAKIKSVNCCTFMLQYCVDIIQHKCRKNVYLGQKCLQKKGGLSSVKLSLKKYLEICAVKEVSSVTET